MFSLSAREHPRLKQYIRLRDVEVGLGDGPFCDTCMVGALNFAAGSLGIVTRGEQLDAHDDFSVILELATYHHRTGGKTTIEQFYEATKPAVGMDEFTVLDAMLNSRVTLLRLKETVRGVGSAGR